MANKQRDSKRESFWRGALARQAKSGVASPAEFRIDLHGGRTLRMSDSISADRLAEIVLALEAVEARA